MFQNASTNEKGFPSLSTFFSNTWFLPLFNGRALLKWVASKGGNYKTTGLSQSPTSGRQLLLRCWPEDTSVLGPCPSLPCGTSHPVREM